MLKLMGKKMFTIFRSDVLFNCKKFLSTILNIMRHFNWVFTVCQVTYLGVTSVKHACTAILTHISLASFLWDIGKQCRPRSDATEYGVWSGSPPSVYLQTVLLKSKKKHLTTLKTEMDWSNWWNWEFPFEGQRPNYWPKPSRLCEQKWFWLDCAWSAFELQ